MNFSKEIKVGNQLIGENHKCFIIAEAGVNHNGDIALAKKLVDAAKYVGADAVKFQTWITEELMLPETKTANYHKETTGEDNFYEMAKKLELTFDEFKELKQYCDDKEILFLSTPDEEKSADFLEGLDVKLFKISSPEFNNPRMIKHCLSKNIPTLLSVGMNSEDTIIKIMDLIKEIKNPNIVLLHCTSEYPAPLDSVNLKYMNSLKSKFDCLVGYSDHTEGDFVGPLSIIEGAKVFEKHLTLDRNMIGPDHKTSINPEEFKELVSKIRQAEKVIGDGVKKITSTEKSNSVVMKKIIVASMLIPAQTILTSKHFKMMRSQEGLEPIREAELIGKKSNREIYENQIIQQEWMD